MNIEDIYVLLCTDEVLTGYLNPYVELWCSFDEEKHITFVFTLDKKGFFRNNNTTLDKIKLFEERLNFIIDGIIHDKYVELEKCVTKFDTVSYKVYIDTDKTGTRLRTIVGYGNNTFREFKYNDEAVSVISLYKGYRVKDDLGLQAKLEPGDLTPRRLQRFFRGKIKEYQDVYTDVYPYLWKKYSTLDKKYRSITFPGVESLVETKAEGLYLIETYRDLDYRLDVMKTERTKRILLARNIVTIEYWQNLQKLKY